MNNQLDVVEKNGVYYQVTVCKGANYFYYRLEKLNKQRRVDRRAKTIIISTSEELSTYKLAGFMACGLFKIVSPAI